MKAEYLCNICSVCNCSVSNDCIVRSFSSVGNVSVVCNSKKEM